MKSILGRVSLRMEKVLMLTRYLNIPIKNMSSVQNYTYTASTFLKPAIERYRKFIRDGFNSTFTEPRCSSLVWGRIESFFFHPASDREPDRVQFSLAFGRFRGEGRTSETFFRRNFSSFYSKPTGFELTSRLAMIASRADGAWKMLLPVVGWWLLVIIGQPSTWEIILSFSFLGSFFYPHRKWNVLLLLFSIQEWRTLARTTQSGYF